MMAIRVLLALLLLEAVLLRSAAFLTRGAFFIDESMLYLAVKEWTLFQPLRFEQTAPLLFLAISRASDLLLGTSEYALRLFPFVASVIACVLVYYAVRTLTSRFAALAALALLGNHLALVQYSAIFKQYESDAMVNALLLATAAFLWRDGFQPKRWPLVLVTGCLAVTLSQSAIFALASFAAWLLWSVRGKSMRPALVIVAVWGALWIALYLTLYSHVAGSPYMQQFWSETYLNGNGDRWRFWLGEVFGSFSGNLWFVSPLLPLGVMGIRYAWQRFGLAFLVLWGGPFALAITASMLGMYPVAERLWLFLMPNLVFGVALGFDACLASKRAIAAIAIVALLISVGYSARRSTQFALSELGRPLTNDLRGTMEQILAQFPNDPVYIAARGIPSWFFYNSRRDRPAPWRDIGHYHAPTFGDSPHRLQPIEQEGDQLQSVIAGRTELYGLGSGTPNHAPRPRMPRVPTPGWAENEARRILGSAKPGAWLYLSECIAFESDALLRELQRRGARIGMTWRHRNYWILHIRSLYRD